MAVVVAAVVSAARRVEAPVPAALSLSTLLGARARLALREQQAPADQGALVSILLAVTVVPVVDSEPQAHLVDQAPRL